ncbi:hypothetical protein PRZ48_007326 [Zasmidium cellare]|uniref:Pet127-domain-containing protein n=1 Tax=Zasmidium cellare TaxID=395010 RepID=A0ABR0EJ16_ZASCE|nr:hypothetical protein PRZ48_007326 [Zasmidium cellare]
MLANVAHSPAWRSQGYVCLACRRQRIVSNRRRHERRFNSTETGQSSQPSYSWFDALNDISDNYSAKPKDEPSESAKPKGRAPSQARKAGVKKKSSHGPSEGMIDGLRSRLDQAIWRDTPKVHTDSVAALLTEIKDTESRNAAAANRTHRRLRRSMTSKGWGAHRAPRKDQQSISRDSLQDLVPGAGSKTAAAGEESNNDSGAASRVHEMEDLLDKLKQKGAAEKSRDQVLTTSQSQIIEDIVNQTGQDADGEKAKDASPTAASKSQLIADLMGQAKQRAEKRDQDSGNPDKNASTKDGVVAVDSSSGPSSPSAVRIRTSNHGHTVRPQMSESNSRLSRRPWPAPSHSGNVQEAEDSVKIRRIPSGDALSEDPSDNTLDTASAEAAAVERASEAAMFDRPMTLVERWLMNQKRTLPWGVTKAPETPVPEASAVSKKVLPKEAPAVKASSTITSAKGSLSARSKQTLASVGKDSASGNKKASLPGLSESIGRILDDMKKRTGADQAVTEVDVASAEDQAQDHAATKHEDEVSSPDENSLQPTSKVPEASAEQQADSSAESSTIDNVTLSEASSALSESTTVAEGVSSLEPTSSSHEVSMPETGSVDSTPSPAEVAAPETESVQAKEDFQPEGEQSEGPTPAHIRLSSLWQRRDEKRESIAGTERSSASAPSSLRDQNGPPLGQTLSRFFHTRSLKAAPVTEAAKEESVEEREETPSNAEIKSIEASSLEVTPLEIPQPPVPYLEYGLDRVLFNPGVYQLQDPTSRVYNFDPYLQKIMPVMEFDFDALKEYKTSSQDQALTALAKEHNKRYIGSTSSMTSSLAHFHFLLSNWRPINLGMLSDDFVGRHTRTNFTEISRAPSAIFLRWKDGTYAIDADKEYDGANVLMLLGKSMELLLTLPTSEYERYRKSDPRQVPESSKTAPEAYQYTTMRDFLMRSQLDAYDPRLPGNGTFDLKTRAVVSVRMQAHDFEHMTGYEIHGMQGKWGSYEREYFDMMRATMLKYMLQARMGRMNGIFVAYHNVKRIFGFQYIPMHEMDRALHGQTDTCLGDQEFKASLEIMNELFNKATAKFPEQSLRFHFETAAQKADGSPTALHVFAEPMSENEIDRIQNSQKAKVQEFERNIMGKTSETTTPAPNAKETDAKASSTPGMSSTNSDADVSFLSSMSTTKTEDTLKPLFYANVIVQSKVNDEAVRDDRPTNLKREDKWEIDYIIKEYDTTAHEWALYEDCRARRKYALTERDDEDGGADPDSDGQSRRENGYMKLLKGMAAQGRAFRQKIDALEADQDAVRVDQPLPREREKIEDVDDYMKWMYGPK